MPILFIPKFLKVLPFMMIAQMCYSQGIVTKQNEHFLATLDFIPESGIYNQRPGRIVNPSPHSGFPNDYTENGIRVSGMVRGAALTVDWWVLFGEPTENYNFQWTSSGQYYVYEEAGIGLTVTRDMVSKYPDLVQRFNAIKPLDVKFRIYWKLSTEAYKDKELHYVFTSSNRNHAVVTDVSTGLLFEPSGKSPLSVPGIRQGNGMQFINQRFDSYQHYDLSEEEKSSWLRFFQRAGTIEIERIISYEVRWPVSEMKSIAEDFIKYENQEKEPSPKEILANELQSVSSLSEFTEGGFWSEPFEETKLNITLTYDNGTWNVRNNGILTYSDSKSVISQFQQGFYDNTINPNTNLLLRETRLDSYKNGTCIYEYNLIDHNGVLYSIDGKTSFCYFYHKKNDEGLYEVLYYTNQWTFVRDICYTAGSGALKLGRITINSSFEEARNNLLNHEDSTSGCNGSKGTSPYGVGEFIRYFLDDKLRVVEKRTEYHVITNYDY